MNRFMHKDATMGVDTGDTGVMDENLDTMVVDVTDLTNISVLLNQITDAGNATLTVEKSLDGTNWIPVGTKNQGDFASGANKAIEAFTLSDGNGMPTACKKIRCTMSDHTSTGSYTMGVAGTQRDGMR